MKKLIYISLIGFLVLACTKGGGNMYVEGRAYNPVTGEGIEGIQIRLWRSAPPDGLYGVAPGRKYVETVFTNADGHYEIKHTGIFQGFYLEVTDIGDRTSLGWINVSTSNKDYPNGGNVFKVKKSKNMHADFQAVPYGYLKLSIHNVNCQGGGDSMRFRFQTIGESDFESWSNYRTGCYMYDDPGGGLKFPWVGECINGR